MDTLPCDELAATVMPRCLLVVPCLNERAHIEPLLDQFLAAARALDTRLVVVDGGSRDGTCEIVAERAQADARIRLLSNPRRIQSAAVNLAVERFGDEADFVIRIDAHGGYPSDYCRVLAEEAAATGADSVVVSMVTSGKGVFQRAAAAAQNSPLGTGGSKHRVGAAGRWIDHGHHALMRIAAFRTVGGYDESFSHNEDAELDHRMIRAGFSIWMTDRTRMVYYPRATPQGLFRQYLAYGKGRARNMLKHKAIPKLRQAVPLLVAPAVLLAAFGLVYGVAVLPMLVWAAVCLGAGVLGAIRNRSAVALLTGLAAMVMHFAWSAGFWLQVLGVAVGRRT